MTLQIYRADIDKLWKHAVEAGAKVIMPITDMFWGDRYGQLEDPEGYRWALGEHKVDLTPEQIDAAAKEFFSKKMAEKP